MTGIDQTDLSRARILVVEDEPLIAMDYVDWLSAAGATVIGPYSTVSEALEVVGDTQPDAAVLDFVLADGNSEPVQKALEEKGVPFVVVTAYPRVLVRRADGCESIHNKPMTADLLCAALREALHRDESGGSVI